MLSNPQGIIFDIKRYAIHDGPGIRTTVFFKGCPLRCLWCHNPESLRPTPEPSLRPVRCTQCNNCIDACPNQAITAIEGVPQTLGEICTVCGSCLDACPNQAREIIGKTVDVPTVLREVDKDSLFYDQSGGGVTFSGGEPLYQPEFLLACVKALKAKRYHITVDTSCHGKREDLMQVAGYTDLFHCDLKHMDPQRHQELTGVDNERILSNIRALSERGSTIIIRIPLIGGVNDDADNIQRSADFVAGLETVNQVDLLPYNRGGLTKIKRLAFPIRQEAAHIVENERLQPIIDTFKQRGLAVKIEG